MGCKISSIGSVVPVQSQARNDTNEAVKRMSIAALKKPESSLIPSKDNVNQNLAIIWANSNIDQSTKECQDFMAELQCITDELYTCSKSEECVHYLNNIGEKGVCLIVSNTLGELLIPLVFPYMHLKCIYIVSETACHRLSWAGQWSHKVKKILFNMKDTIEAIKADSSLTSTLIPISVLHRIELSGADKDRLDQSFMYTQLLKDILIKMPNEDAAKAKLVEYCRRIYVNNILELGLIDEFNQGYTSDIAIEWYTRETFLYATLNRVLRTQDIEGILKMGFFARDLHEQITTMHRNLSLNKDKFTVYRGQAMSISDFEKVKTSNNGLISFNSFLSTTRDECTAKLFAKQACFKDGAVAILFRMEIDPKTSSIPYALLNEKSVYKNENEMLFSMHTVFRIRSVQEQTDQYSLIHLELTADNDPQLKLVTDYFRKEIGGGTRLDQLGHLLIKMGEYNQAEEIYAPQFSTTDVTNWRRYMHLNHQLGCVYNKKGDYPMALEYYEKALKTELQFLASNDLLIAVTYNNMASVYESMANYSSALAYYENAHKIEVNSLAPDNPTLATTYSNIGALHNTLGDFSTALAYYEKALEIRKKTLPPKHPDLGIVYNNMGGIHVEMGDYPAALKLYKKTLDIQEKSLPPKHPSLATSYSNFGLIHKLMDDKISALEFYRKALYIREASLPENHPDKAHSHNSIGSVYDAMEDYPKALSCFQKAFEIQNKCLAQNHPDLAHTYDNLGSVHRSMDDNKTALSYYQKALELRTNALPPNHPDIATSYNNLGTMHSSMGDKKEALACYEKALKIRQGSLPLTHPSMVSTYNNIGSVHHAMKDYSTALSWFEKALEIQKQTLDSKHRDLATTYKNIGLAYHELKNYQKALSFYEKALEIEQASFPDDHENLGTSYNNIALVYNAIKDYSHALVFHKKALVIREKKGSSKDMQLASTCTNIASTYYEMKDYSNAVLFYKKSIDIRE